MNNAIEIIKNYDLEYSNQYIPIEVQNKYIELLNSIKDYFVKSFSQSGSMLSPSDSQIKLLNSEIEDLASHIPGAFSNKDWDALIDYATKCKEKQLMISNIVSGVKDNNASSMEVPKIELQKKLLEVEKYNLDELKKIDSLDSNGSILFSETLRNLGNPRELINAITSDIQSKFDLKIASYKSLINISKIIINNNKDVYSIDSETQTDYFISLGFLEYKDNYNYDSISAINDKIKIQNIFTKYLNTHLLSEEELVFLKRFPNIDFLEGNTSFVVSQMNQRNINRY